LASIEALQLGIGCGGNPLEEDYDHFHVLATPCWLKSFWDFLHFYHFQIYVDYPCLHLPRCNDNLLITIFWLAGYRESHLHSLILCRLAHNLLFLLDMSTADGRTINLAYLLPPKHTRRRQCTYVFPSEHSARADWRRWMEFWTSFMGHGGQLYCPLGEWIYTSHRIWEWFYWACTDRMYRVSGNKTTVYKHSSAARVRLRQEYKHAGYIDQLPQGCVPVDVLVLPKGRINRRGFGPPLANPQHSNAPFWEFLRSLGGEWMWQYVKEGEVDVGWIRDALVNGTLIGVTNGSYDRIIAQMVSGAGWVLTCTASHRTL
jgi:hypothetical protein